MNGENVHTAQTPGILSCSEGRWFWVSWRDGLIEVGKGIEPGLDMIMFWQDPSGGHEVQSVGVSTDAETKGVFEFLEGAEGNIIPPHHQHKYIIFS